MRKTVEDEENEVREDVKLCIGAVIPPMVIAQVKSFDWTGMEEIVYRFVVCVN